MAEPDSSTEDLVRDFQRRRDADESFRILFRRHFFVDRVEVKVIN